jgi:hypothetical protein
MCPTVVGEIGIPYDMDGKSAYLTGDYSQQIQAMDANMAALEKDLLSFTLWNYTCDNSHQWGDQWNGEDLSIWSPPLSSIISPVSSTGHKSGLSMPIDLDEGGRALEAFVRPHPICIPGIPKSISFELAAGTFTFSFTHSLCEDGTWDLASQGLTSKHVEIFLPILHFPTADSFEVWTSSGNCTILLEHQRLLWTCGCLETGAGERRYIQSSEALSAKQLNRSKVSDTLATHKIVIQKKRADARNPADIAMAMDQVEEDPICPTVCSLM